MSKARFCRYCGAELPEDANFCESCGTVIEENDTPAPSGEKPKHKRKAWKKKRPLTLRAFLFIVRNTIVILLILAVLIIAVQLPGKIKDAAQQSFGALAAYSRS